MTLQQIAAAAAANMSREELTSSYRVLPMKRTREQAAKAARVREEPQRFGSYAEYAVRHDWRGGRIKAEKERIIDAEYFG